MKNELTTKPAANSPIAAIVGREAGAQSPVITLSKISKANFGLFGEQVILLCPDKYLVPGNLETEI